MAEPLHFVSLSGGKDSTAMLLMMCERGISVDAAFWFDGGWEWPEISAHIQRIIDNTGVNVVKVAPPQPFDWYMFEKPRIRGKHAGEFGYGWPLPRARWCTRLKADAINAAQRKYADGRPWVPYIGIAADESSRAVDENARYPLIDWGMTEADCLAYCYARGYDFGGLYEGCARVSCYCCPLQSIGQLRWTFNNRPEQYAQMLSMEERANNKFKEKYTVSGLAERFAAEGTQLSI